MAVVAHSGLSGEAEIQRLRTLYRLLAALSRASAPEDVYDVAIASLLAATTADRAAILMFDNDGVIRFKAWRDLSVEYRETVAGHTPWPKGTRDAQPLVVPDVQADKNLAAYHEAFIRENIRAVAFIPLALEGGVFGKFMLYYGQAHACTPDELEIAQAIAMHVALATERKRAELASANAEQRLQSANLHLAAIVESSNDAVVGKDLNGIITSWNRGAERLFGYTAAEAIGKPVAMLAPSESLNEMPDILGKIRQGHRVEHYETRRRRKDGTAIDVSLTVSPIRNAAGQIVGASKIARDITEKKRAEQERAVLLEREQEARQTAELLNRVSLRLAAQLDAQKLIEAVTDIATALVGAEFGSFFQEKSESEALHIRSGAAREASAGFQMPPNAGLFGPVLRGEGVVRCGDATIEEGRLPVRSYLAAPVVSRSGEVLGGLFFGHAAAGRFTEYHEAILAGIASQTAIALDNARLFEQAQWVQTELKRSNEELRRANQDLEIFAYSASHDLQEPLRTIAISAQLLARNSGNQLQGENAAFLTSILGSANRMTALIQDLLTYMRATKYAEGPPPAVDAARVLAGVRENLKGAIEEAGAIVTSSSLPMISMHEGRLSQVFQNLIGNAIKYRSTEVPRVHISSNERDGWCVFSVVDNGIGIETKFADQIFGLFKRLHSRHEYPGSGIGLAICQRIVEQYGGRIWVEKSTPGGGSTFCFAIPSGAR